MTLTFPASEAGISEGQRAERDDVKDLVRTGRRGIPDEHNE